MHAQVRPAVLRAIGPLFIALAMIASPGAEAQQADTAHTAKAEPAPPPDTARLTKDASYGPKSDRPWGSVPARFSFAAGGFLPHIGTTATISGALLPATQINLEQKLGLSPNTQTVDLYGQWRFATSNVVTIEFFKIVVNSDVPGC